MAFAIKRKEAVGKAIRRLGRERVENASECLRNCKQSESVHCARKDIKKMRAVLRLARSSVPKKKFRRIADLLREAAQYLGQVRDAHVKVETIKGLQEHFKGQIAPGSWRYIRAELGEMLKEEIKRFSRGKTVPRVERIVKRAGKEFDGLTLKRKGWKALAPGIEGAYLGGQHAYQTAANNPLPEHFHEWRKRAKDLWYHVTILSRMWPDNMEGLARELELLGEQLGDDHDLCVLRETADERCSAPKHKEALETLHALIDARQQQLRTAALALGARFYAEDSSVFCQRLRQYWRIWRREEDSVPMLAAA